MEAVKSSALILEAPEFFEDPDFVAWLNNGRPKFTWHEGGEPGEYSDVVVLVDPGLSGEGSDSDMPEHIWDRIVAMCCDHFAGSNNGGNHIMVWIKNL